MLISKRIFDTKSIVVNFCNTFRKSFIIPATISIINFALYSNKVQSSVPYEYFLKISFKFLVICFYTNMVYLIFFHI